MDGHLGTVLYRHVRRDPAADADADEISGAELLLLEKPVIKHGLMDNSV